MVIGSTPTEQDVMLELHERAERAEADAARLREAGSSLLQAIAREYYSDEPEYYPGPLMDAAIEMKAALSDTADDREGGR